MKWPDVRELLQDETFAVPFWMFGLPAVSVLLILGGACVRDVAKTVICRDCAAHSAEADQ